MNNCHQAVAPVNVSLTGCPACSVLESMPISALQECFLTTFGKPTASNNRTWLCSKLHEPALPNADGARAVQAAPAVARRNKSPVTVRFWSLALLVFTASPGSGCAVVLSGSEIVPVAGSWMSALGVARDGVGSGRWELHVAGLVQGLSAM